MCSSSASLLQRERVKKMAQTEVTYQKVTSKNVTSKEHLLLLLIIKAIRQMCLHLESKN